MLGLGGPDDDDSDNDDDDDDDDDDEMMMILGLGGPGRASQALWDPPQHRHQSGALATAIRSSSRCHAPVTRPVTRHVTRERAASDDGADPQTVSGGRVGTGRRPG